MLRSLFAIALFSSCISYRVHEDDRTPAGYTLALAGDAVIATACTLGAIFDEDDKGEESWPVWKAAPACAGGTAVLDTAVMLLIFVGQAVVNADNMDGG